LSWLGLRKTELYGFLSSVAGIAAVLVSSNGLGEYLSIPGVALATLGMTLMCFGMAWQRKN
jgi:uncharacterized membrane protein